LPLAELHKVLDELDPHLNRLILVEIIERLEEQSGDRGTAASCFAVTQLPAVPKLPHQTYALR
jgi:hypothetical protein